MKLEDGQNVCYVKDETVWNVEPFRSGTRPTTCKKSSMASPKVKRS